MLVTGKKLSSLRETKLALLAAMALVAMAGAAQAGRPVALSAAQMDQISAGGIPLPSCDGLAGCGSIATSSSSSVVTAVDNHGTVTTTSTTNNQVNCGPGCSFDIATVTNTTQSTPSGSGAGTSPGTTVGSVVIPMGSLNGLGM
jgi:hypothetical protein